MNVIAFDTSTEIMSIALSNDSRLFSLSMKIGLKHSEQLLPSIELLLNKAEIEIQEIDLIICSRGPGSFTGLRIGMATAKGLAMGASAPLVAVSSLALYAAGLEYFDGLVIPLIDAKKKQFFCGFYKKGSAVYPHADLAPDTILEQINGERALLTGPHANLFCERISHSQEKNPEQIILDSHYSLGKSEIMLELGKKEFELNGPLDNDAGPIYLRKSDAELSLLNQSGPAS